MAAIPASVFNNADVRLRGWFDDGTPNGSQLLTPDQRIAPNGYLPSNLTLTGTGTATAFSGDGSGLTNIPASAVTGTIPASQIAAAPPGMAFIPAGAFTMGDSLDGWSDATPISTTVSAFYMDVNEVTLSQWQAVQQWATLVGGYTGLTVGSGKGATHPVQTVSWV